MTHPAYDEQDRRRRGLLVALGAVVMLLLGILSGWLAFGEQGRAVSQPRGPRPTPSAGAVLPSGAAQSRPTAPPGPVVVTGSGEAQSRAGRTREGDGVTVAGDELVVSGRVAGSVGPGQEAELVITISNASRRPVVVTAVTGRVTAVTSGGAADKPACSASWYRVGSFAGSTAVAPEASTTVSLGLTFDDLSTVNQDNCKGARFTYTFTAMARQP